MPDARQVIEGLMEIAEIAMPDTYFETDSRVVAAREWLAGHEDGEANEADARGRPDTS